MRTDPDAPKHKGITWVICPMNAKGMEIRPIRTMAGHQDFCEVFYDEVRVPRANVVGQINDGQALIDAGLHANEKVVVNGQYRLVPDARVQELQGRAAQEADLQSSIEQEIP